MKRFLLLSLLLLTCWGAVTVAQDETDILAREYLIKQKSLLIQTDDMSPEEMRVQKAMVELTNGGQPGLYENKRVHERIMQLIDTVWETDDNAAMLAELDELLEGYLPRFQAENFTRDYNFIWMLGRVKEQLGDTALAVLYFQLAELHNHSEEREAYLDNLLSATRSEWVTIEEYYKLLKIRKRVDTMLRDPKIKEKMSDAVNSSDADYAPHMHRSDSVLIFTSRRDTSGLDRSTIVDPFGTRNEDLYVSEFDIFLRDWQPAHSSPFRDSVNTQYSEGSACLSDDAKTLFFTRCHPTEGIGNCDIYMASYDPATQTFVKVRNLGPNVNSPSWDSQPHLSQNGKALFFVSARNGGFGGTDIYVSYFDSTTMEWGPASNLGPLINTARSEITPFYLADKATLYFSSTGHLFNYGGHDIFKSHWLGDRWEIPKNVGPLVNDVAHQEYFSISGDGRYIYYASSPEGVRNRVDQDYDLFSFPMPMEALGEADAWLKGVLRDSVTGYPLVGRVIVIDLEEGIEVTPKVLNDSGYFEFQLIDNRRYRLYVVGDNYLTVKRNFRMEGDTTFNIFTKSFEEGKPFVFERMEFRTNSSKLSGRNKPNLDHLARFLNNYPQFKLIIEGHTDAVGDADRNMELSIERAERIQDYIMRKGGFDPARISSTGYGETRPLVPNDTEENRAQNRRVEFKLVVDETYEGEIFWPTDEEFFFEDDPIIESDPDFDGEFDWEDIRDEGWDTEPLIEDDFESPIGEILDPSKELDAMILEALKEEAKRETPAPKGSGD